MKEIWFNLQQKHYMDIFSYDIGLGIVQKLIRMDANDIAVAELAQAI